MALMESGEVMEQKLSPKEVILVISGTEESSNMSNQTGDSNAESKEPRNLKPRIQLPTKTTRSSSPEITKLSPPLNKPPKSPEWSLIRHRVTPTSPYGKPKSRFFEQTLPTSSNFVEEGTQTEPETSTHKNSRQNISNASKRSVDDAPGGGQEDEDENDDQVYKTGDLQQYDVKRVKNVKFIILIEWGVFVCMIGFFIASLTIPQLRDVRLWSLEIWKWCGLALVIFCGRLFIEWLSKVLVFLIERNFLLNYKVIYFIYALKGCVTVFIWLGLVLLSWVLFINSGVERSRQATNILNHITRGLASILIGAGMWMVKTLLVKLLASSFHVKTFFDRIQESLFHQYVLQTLSGPPLMEYAEKTGSSSKSGQLSFRKSKRGKREKEVVIDVDKLHKMKPEKVSAWTMGRLVKVIVNSGLSTICDALNESVEQKEITSELEAKVAARNIFRNVAKRGTKFIEEDDLFRFMTLEEVDHMRRLFQGFVETGKIKRSSLENWVVNVYRERKCLAYSLNDTKTAIEELNKIISGMVIVMIIIVWLLVMGITTTNVLMVILPEILLLVFVFGKTAQTVFEAIIFVFVMHPFDVGDRCVIDAVQMVVEEMNILTTIFLTSNNKKLYYPNEVLATLPISNFNRSPEMCDSMEFAVDVSTSIESIVALKAKIKAYLESKPRHWRPGHSVQVKEIEDVNKIKMCLNVTHTINFQHYAETSSRRSDLVLELKKYFEEFGIKYLLLPQEDHATFVGSEAPTWPTITRP